MEKASTPLLKTKFYIPPQRPNLVFRPRLMARLGEALRLQHRLTLIAARAGSGKTTLVSEWLRQQERPSAWLSLESNDNDPGRFFSYLVMALQQLAITIRHTQLSELAMPELPPAEALITELINDIAAASTPFILVLDDYHLIQNEWIYKAIGFLIEHQPPEMHLIIVTRVDPQLPLAPVASEASLLRSAIRDLRFTTDEVVTFLNDVMGLELPAEAVATIELRTEGWIVGLRMAAISMQGHKQEGDLGAFIEAFGGTNRFILDYLLEEVLNQQAPAVQDFLAETSILDRMCPELCDAVRLGGTKTPDLSTELSAWGRKGDAQSGSSESEKPPGVPMATDSQAILVQLERANLFVISLDDERRWYRYHHLFADLLQSVLSQRKSAEQIRELHRRAGQWYQDEELLGESMIHIMAAQDFERAASMIDANIAGLLHMFSRNHMPLLLSWIEKLPEETKRSRPWIDVYRASMLALNLQLDEVDPILEDVEKRIEPGSPRAAEMLGHMAAVRSYCANLHGNVAQAISMAALAKHYLHGGEYLAARGMAAYALADTHFAGDDMKGASLELLDLLRIGEKAGQLMIIVPAFCDLAAIKRVQGRLQDGR